ncbi:MAG: hypothetical protein MJ252_15020 [archaeon]|nr:hypothetical protein [archaeon]
MQCEKESRYPFLIPAMPMQVPQNQMQGKMCPYMVPMPYMNYPMNMMSQNQQGVNPNQSQTDNNFYKSNNPYVHKP